VKGYLPWEKQRFSEDLDFNLTSGGFNSIKKAIEEITFGDKDESLYNGVS